MNCKVQSEAFRKVSKRVAFVKCPHCAARQLITYYTEQRDASGKCFTVYCYVCSYKA